MVLNDNDVLVVNQCSAPPPPRQAIPERDPHRDIKKPAKRERAEIISCPEGAASHTKLQINIKLANAAARDDPSKYIVLQSTEDVLREIDSDGNVMAAFHSESGFLDQLPAGRMKELIASLTGQPGRTCIKLDHVRNSDFVYEIVRRSSTGARKIDKMLVEGIERSSLSMRNDYDSKIYTGTQAASFSIIARDLYDIGNGYAIMGPSYPWDHQYAHDIIPATLQRMFYESSLLGLEDDGTKVGDVLHLQVPSDPAGNMPVQRPLLILSGFSPTEEDDIILAGEHKNILVRTSMGVSFTFDQLAPSLREAVSGGGNPSLATCHGFVLGIADTHDGIVLTVRIALTRDNLPSFLKWPRLPQDAVLQTNLQAIIPAKCVVSTFKIVAVQFHSVAGYTRRDKRALGTIPSQPIKRDVYVAGHLHFVMGAFQQDIKSGPEAQSDSDRVAWKDWHDRSSNESYKAFALLSDFCARGGAISDKDFAVHHAPWKERYLELTRLRDGGRRLPQVTLARVTPFPASEALTTIYKCAHLLGNPLYGPYIFELHAAVRRCAEAKARKAKYRPGAAVLVSTNLPGAVLMQLVHEYAKEASVVFKEGAVEAVVDLFESAKHLIESDNCDDLHTDRGVFNLGGSGIIEFFAPITFRWVLYNPKKCAEDADIPVEGRAEIIFSRYVAKDRHGADLAGEINTNDRGGGGESRDQDGEKRKPGQTATNGPRHTSGLPGNGTGAGVDGRYQYY